MQRTILDRNILKVEKFLDAAGEPDLGAMLADFGIGGERLAELTAMLQTVKTARLRSDVQLSRQKDLTARKDERKRTLQAEVARLSDLIRSRYPEAAWLSSLGLETRYQTVKDETQKGSEPIPDSENTTAKTRPKAVRRGKSEAEFRSRCFLLVENVTEVDASIQEFLNGRGWTAERIANLKTLLAEFLAACEARDRNLRLARQRNAELAEAIRILEVTYRSFSRQARSEAGDDALGQKLEAATAAWTK